MDSTDTAVALTLEVVDESGENKVLCGMRGLDASIYTIFFEADNDVVCLHLVKRRHDTLPVLCV